MKSKTIKRPRKAKALTPAALEIKGVRVDYCHHCGGALKHSLDEVKCVMCGREAGHHCGACLYDGNKAAA